MSITDRLTTALADRYTNGENPARMADDVVVDRGAAVAPRNW